MGVYIEGMEMPTEGGTICVYKISGKFFAARAGKDELFPIIPIPEPHGRLIDASEKIGVQMYDDMTEEYYIAEMTIDDLLSHKGWVEANAPTVIPASESKDRPAFLPTYELTPRKTNADRIRSMSDEELAEWFYSGDFPWCVYEEDVVPCTYEDIPVHPCDRCLLDWLKQEVK